jgi:phosphate transport system substrate-binding protein
MTGEFPHVGRRDLVLGAGTAGLAALAGCKDAARGTPPGGVDRGDGPNTGAGSDGGHLTGEISITGSSTVFPLATAVAEEFQQRHPGVNISTKSTGSGGGFENFFCTGESEVNNASREIKESERERCRENGVEPHEIRVATDALTVIVNNDNDWATEMTVDHLAQIWGPGAGENQTWSDVESHWPDETIERFGAAETSGTFDYFTEVINGEAGAHTQAYEPTENDRSIVQGVTGSPYAIGYFGFSFYYQNPDLVTAVAVDDGDGPVEPSLETAQSGEYTPLSRPLFTYPSIDALADEHVAQFCLFFLDQSSNRSLVAEEVGYVPNSEDVVQTQRKQLEAAIDSART